MKKVFWTLCTMWALVLLMPAGFAAMEVQEGDWAKYQVAMEVPEQFAGMEEYAEFSQVDWLKIEVVTVSEASATVKMTIHYSNGTELTETLPGTGFIIDTDLSQGDEVPTPMFPTEVPLYLTGTRQQTFGGASREVNYVEFNMDELGISMDMSVSWDKATGILCETIMSISGEIGGEPLDMSISARMTETSLWAGGLLPGPDNLMLYALIAVAIMVVAVAAILLLRRKLSPIPAVEPAPSEMDSP